MKQNLALTFPGVSYNGEKMGVKSIGISLKAEYSLGSLSVDIPMGPINISIGGKYGLGASVKAGYIPGSKDNRFFGISAALGVGLELGVKPRN